MNNDIKPISREAWKNGGEEPREIYSMLISLAIFAGLAVLAVTY